MQYFKLLAIALAAITTASCNTKKQEPAKQDTETVPVKLLPLTSSHNRGTIAASGKFTTDDEVFLSFKTGGVINKIFVKEGDAVHAGQLIATLHLTEINAQLAQAQAGLEKAQRDYQRVTNLYKDSVASLEQLQNAKTALELSKQQLSAIQFNRNFSEIRAPQSGYVLRKLANEGQYLAAGTAVLQTNGARSDNWFLRIGLSDKDWSAIHIGDKARVTADVSSGKTFEGTVFRKAEGVDPITGTFSVDIKLAKTGEQNFASGMFGNAVLTPAERPSATTAAPSWIIPYDALLDGDGTSGFVFISNDDKTAKKVRVTIGSMEKDNITITGGLEDSRSLIISGSAYLADGSKIKVIQ